MASWCLEGRPFGSLSILILITEGGVMLRSHECRYCAQWKDNPRAIVYTARGTSHYIPAMWLAGRVLMSGDKWVGGYYQACKDWAEGCKASGACEALSDEKTQVASLGH